MGEIEREGGKEGGRLVDWERGRDGESDIHTYKKNKVRSLELRYREKNEEIERVWC